MNSNKCYDVSWSDKNERRLTQSKKSIFIRIFKVIVLTLVITCIDIVFYSKYQSSNDFSVHILKGNIVLVDKVLYKNSSPQRNDIVIVDYKDANQREAYYQTEVIAIGGDRI